MVDFFRGLSQQPTSGEAKVIARDTKVGMRAKPKCLEAETRKIDDAFSTKAEQLSLFSPAGRQPRRQTHQCLGGELLGSGTPLSVITRSLRDIRKWLPDARLSNVRLLPESSDRLLGRGPHGFKWSVARAPCRSKIR